ncbi:MAG: MBL fold metallo-hydrolase [Candidatus Omnitrophota bacterium]
MKIHFLGTNGWYDTDTGNTTCVFIETDKNYIILDAGFGFYKAKNLIKKNKPVHLFISHLHLDHIIGLHTLPLFKVPGGIDIYIPKGMRKFLQIFLNKPYTSDHKNLATKIKLYELDTKKPYNIKLKFGRLLHSPICYGFRFVLEGKTVAYCTDTGKCDELYKLAKDCDLLITECSFRPGEDASKAAHLNPQVAAKIAGDSGVKKLALIHFDAGRYNTIKLRKIAEKSARNIFPGTFAATDNQIIKL